MLFSSMRYANQAPTQRKASEVASEPPRYRYDIDGLRAVAILLVVIYHVWLNRVSGGVDAFLMISAFFLTGSLLRRVEAGHLIRPTAQWLRTFRRLLPMAAFIIATTVLAGSVFLPGSMQADLWRQGWASLFYFQNWLLAAESVDYYADNAFASPLQHFWSLSVQGQVFILWPLIFAAIAIIVRAAKIQRVRAFACAVFGTIFAASLVYSIFVTTAHQESAYFNTGARLWEFAAGSILAIVLPKLRMNSVLAGVIGWIGLVALVSCGVVLDVQGGFPGFLALWPVLSVAAIIVSGSGAGRRYGPARFLETAPVLSIGRTAYSLYLVHWPILIFVLVARDGEPLGFAEGMMVILFALGLAYVCTWLIDARITKLMRAREGARLSLSVILVSLVVAAAPLVTFQQIANNHSLQLSSLSEAERARLNPGARVLAPDWNGRIPSGAERIPLATSLDEEWGVLPEECTASDLPALRDAPAERCSTNGLKDPERTVFVVGDSHPEQWLAPLERIAEQEGWRLTAILNGGCSFGVFPAHEDLDYVSDLTDTDIVSYEECRDWNSRVLTNIEEVRPDIVITMGTRTFATDNEQDEDAGEREEVRSETAAAIDILRPLGIVTVVFRDTPRFTFDSFTCLERSKDPDECGVTEHRALASSNPADALEGWGVVSIDLSDLFCPEGFCPPAIGNVAVYMDDNHPTSSYMRTTKDVLERRLLGGFQSATPFTHSDS